MVLNDAIYANMTRFINVKHEVFALLDRKHNKTLSNFSNLYRTHARTKQINRRDGKQIHAAVVTSLMA